MYRPSDPENWDLVRRKQEMDRDRGTVTCIDLGLGFNAFIGRLMSGIARTSCCWLDVLDDDSCAAGIVGIIAPINGGLEDCR